MNSFFTRGSRAPFLSKITALKNDAHHARQVAYNSQNRVLKSVQLCVFAAALVLMGCNEEQPDTAATPSDANYSLSAFQELCLNPSLSFDEIGNKALSLGFVVEAIDEDPAYGFVNIYNHDANVSLTKSAMASRYTCSTRFFGADEVDLNAFRDSFVKFAASKNAKVTRTDGAFTFDADGVTYSLTAANDTAGFTDVSFSYTR